MRFYDGQQSPPHDESYGSKIVAYWMPSSHSLHEIASRLEIRDESVLNLSGVDWSYLDPPHRQYLAAMIPLMYEV